MSKNKTPEAGSPQGKQSSRQDSNRTKMSRNPQLHPPYDYAAARLVKTRLVKQLVNNEHTFFSRSGLSQNFSLRLITLVVLVVNTMRMTVNGMMAIILMVTITIWAMLK